MRYRGTGAGPLCKSQIFFRFIQQIYFAVFNNMKLVEVASEQISLVLSKVEIDISLMR